MELYRVGADPGCLKQGEGIWPKKVPFPKRGIKELYKFTRHGVNLFFHGIYIRRVVQNHWCQLILPWCLYWASCPKPLVSTYSSMVFILGELSKTTGVNLFFHGVYIGRVVKNHWCQLILPWCLYWASCPKPLVSTYSSMVFILGELSKTTGVFFGTLVSAPHTTKMA